MKNPTQPSQPWVIANWKMNPATQAEVTALTSQLATHSTALPDCNVVISPSFLHLQVVKQTIATTSPIHLAAQNLCAENADKGAFTGEVSANQLVDMGVNFVLVGHSERRQYYSETDTILRKKIQNAFTHGLSVVFCIGETHEQYLAKQTFSVIEQQLELLADFAQQIPLPNTLDTPPKLLIAYEPVWAIGTGLTPSLDEIDTTHNFISEWLSNTQIYAPILYGGSVNANNAHDIASLLLVNGALVGGASLNATSFYQIIHAFAQK